MGKCKYCGKPAGFLRRSHSLCKALHNGELERISKQVSKALLAMNFDEILVEQEMLDRAYIGQEEYNQHVSNLIYLHYSKCYNSSDIGYSSECVSFIGKLVERFPQIINVKDNVICKIFCKYVVDCMATFENGFNIDDFNQLNKTYILPYAHLDSDKKLCYNSCLCKYLDICVDRGDVQESDMQFIAEYGNQYKVAINDFKNSDSYDNFLNLLVVKIAKMQGADETESLFLNIVSSLHLTKEDFKPYAIAHFDKIIDAALDDGFISSEEEFNIRVFLSVFDLEQVDVDKKGRYKKFVQSLILQELEDGQIPSYFKTALIPVVLGKTEYLIWGDQNVVLHQCKVKREYVGGSSGVSMRVCKGVYYRVGACKGTPIEHSYYENIGEGVLLYTNKNLIFYSPMKSVKIPYKKIISVTPYSDGFEVHKDGVNGKPTMFESVDSWFLMNLLSIIGV